MTYSPQLISEMQSYFTEKYGLSLSDEQAVRCLDSLADVYGVMEQVAAARAQLPQPPDLIYVPHND